MFKWITQALRPALESHFKHDKDVLVEKWLKLGKEFTVGFLGEQMPSIRIQPAAVFYDYEAKYISDDTKYFCPVALKGHARQKSVSWQKPLTKPWAVKAGSRVDVMLDVTGSSTCWK